MGILRIVVWTALCIGFGLFLGTYELGGRTAWQAAQGVWKQQAPRLEKVKESAQELAQPKERHSKEDREAIDQIISKRSKG